MCGSRHFRRSSAFTLIELLVVVSLIVLLVAMLMPALGRAREQSKRAVCASNLAQIHHATVDYAQNYRQYVPPRYYAYSQYHVGNYYTSSSSDGGDMGFKLLVNAGHLSASASPTTGVSGGPGVLFCPSDPNWSADTFWPNLSFGADWKPYLSSYAQREILITQDRFRLSNVSGGAAYLSDWFTTAIPANPYSVHGNGWTTGYFDGATGWVEKTDALWAGINWSTDYTGQAPTWWAFDR